jgi:hypothetical protein
MAKVNLQRSYSKLNESIVKLYDESGVRRSLTVPYVDGQDMAEHISAVGQAAGESGGLTKSLILSAHHSTGKGWGSGDGHSVGFLADKLRTTLIPKDDENAKAAISAAQTHINNLSTLLGKDNPVIQTAQGQLNLVKQTNGQSMNLLDFGVMLTQLMYRPSQAVAKAHSATKPGGAAPQGRAPGDLQPDQSAGGEQQQQQPDQGNQGEAQPQESAQAAPEAAPQQESAPAAQGA